MNFGMDAPSSVFLGPPEERDSLVKLTPEWCTVRDDTFFIRGIIEIPIRDNPEPFVWGVWVSLSEKNFRRAGELWNVEGRENEPPYFGWLCSTLPGYPDTLRLKTHVHTRPVGSRPTIEIEPTDHLLAVEQREGITMAQVYQKVEKLLHED